MTMMPEHIEELEQLASKATPGPWQYGDADRFDPSGEVENVIEREGGRGLVATIPTGEFEWDRARENESSRADADFIAAARTALPALCQEWRRLQMELKEQNDAYRVALREGEVMNEMIERLQAENESLRLSQNDTPPQ